MWVIKEKTGKNRKNRQNPDFHCLFFGQPSNWVALFFFKSDGLLELRSAVSTRNVEASTPA
jgi:hypothetical protein